MNDIKDSVIVAIELGSSRIAGIAGKMKDGTMQIVAYAEDRTTDCIKRGIVYNIEKTTQGIRNVVTKLETLLNKNINCAYIGLGGQSVRSINTIVKRNMLTPTYINQSHIDSITDESHEISLEDCELIAYFTQDFVVDTNAAVTDPVGIMGTNIEGKFLNVVANHRLKQNINTTFENLGIDIADYGLTSFALANNILTDTEKRSGCAMIDFGAGTTTIVVIKSNIVRQIVTIPLGTNNIIQDLCSEQIQQSEAEELLAKYANAIIEDADYDSENTEIYHTLDGLDIEVPMIRHIIYARFNEIIQNVKIQLEKTDYADQLIGGLVVTGGGANIKNIDKSCTRVLGIDKVRIAKTVIAPMIKNSTLTNLQMDCPQNTTILSLLLSGTENCVSDGYSGPDIFHDKEREKQIQAKNEAAAEQQKEEDELLESLEATKSKLREIIVKMQHCKKSIEEDSSVKRNWVTAKNLIAEAEDVPGDDFSEHVSILSAKDKYKQAVREAEELVAQCDAVKLQLEETERDAEKQNSTLKKISNFFNDLLNNE